MKIMCRLSIRFERAAVVLAASWLALAVSCNGFVVPPTNLCHQQSPHTSPIASRTVLKASSLGDDGDDELSKLLSISGDLEKELYGARLPFDDDDDDDENFSFAGQSVSQNEDAEEQEIAEMEASIDESTFEGEWSNLNEMPDLTLGSSSSDDDSDDDDAGGILGVDPNTIDLSILENMADGTGAITATSQAAAQAEMMEGETKMVKDYQEGYMDENALHIPNRIGFTTRRWGDASQGFVASGKKLSRTQKRSGMFNPGDAQVAYNTMIQNGISFIETSFAHGKSSQSQGLAALDILARCMEDDSEYDVPLLDVTSPSAIPVAMNLLGSLEGVCDRLRQPTVELFQSKFKVGLGRSFVNMLEDGQCNAVGVVNFGKRGVERMAKYLEKNDYFLTSNQFDFSLTNRKKMGLIDACKDLGVIPLISNPLDNGLASGLYTAGDPSGGDITRPSGPFGLKQLEDLQPLHGMQGKVAERVRKRVKKEQRELKDSRGRKSQEEKNAVDTITTTQIAINYVVAKGGVPLVDVTDLRTAEEVVGCLGWALTDEEVDMLDRAATLASM